MADHRPIGIFDSGVGGLTVVREVLRQLPHESVLYLGDTARVPYGPRGQTTIARFALQLVEFLLRRDVKALVVACNTVSAAAIEAIRAQSPVPVLDVIGPTVEAAVRQTQSNLIGVIGTVATINSGVYTRTVQGLKPEAKLLLQACPLFVPIAEEGLAEHEVARLMAEEYLQPFKGTPMDTMVLGCTHYPLLKATLAQVLGPEVALIDSAEPTVRRLADLLQETGMAARRGVMIGHQFCVTDASEKFTQIASRFLGGELSGCVSHVEIG
jgi:glutamate racemase